MRTSIKLLIGLMLFLGGFAVGGALLTVAAQLASLATTTHADATINVPVERIVFFPADMEFDFAVFGEFVLLDDAVTLNQNGEADASLVTIPRLIVNEEGQEAVEQLPTANGNCTYNADQIVLYEHGNYQGACKTFNVGDYANPRAMGFANDAASSLRVGGNVKAGLCEHDNFQGACEWLTGDDSNLGNNAIGNDRVSSLRVQRKSSGGGTTPPGNCTYNADQIMLYEHGNYQGACKTLNVGDYANPGAMSFANDAASSIRVGGNVKAGMCEHDNYQGVCDWFAGDDPDLGNNAIGNDRVSSLRVQRKTTNGGGTSDPRQEGVVQVTGKLERGNRVYITIHIKNYGNAPTPAIHPYVEGTTSGNFFWRADGSEPGRAVIQPGQTVSFRVQHDLPVTGVWIANGIFLWNNDAGTYWKPLPANGQNQRFAFNVTDAPVATCPSISDWKGEYFGNRGLSGAPVMCRNDGAINFDWGGGAPDGRVPSDNFSVRWTRNASFENARYKFTVAADDGIRLWVNNALVIDQWKDQGTTTYTWEGNLPGGALPLKVEYYENGGGAVARVQWEKITTTATCPSISDWKGEYFGNRGLSGTPVLCRNDGAINFDWGGGAPAGNVPSDNFSVRWTRNASFENARYKFTVAADDGIRLWVNNTLVIDQWKDQGTTTYTWEGNLPGGSLPLKVEYYENGGGAVARVQWEKAVSGNDKLRGKKVALDPGHGWGGDPGASANGMLEKDLTLDIANRAKGRLEAYGIQVALTRTGDEPRLGLSSAATRVNQFGANLAVAIHVNAGGGTGTESCYVVNKSTSGASQRLATMLTNQVSRQMGLYKRGDFAENNSGRCGRGRSQLYIHDMDPVTALIETAFIDGPANNDVAKLRDNRDGFAKAVSDAIVEYLQSQ